MFQFSLVQVHVLQSLKASPYSVILSGGHTTEAITLVSSLDFERYSPRTYIIGEGDVLSTQKAVKLEELRDVSSMYSSIC